MTALPDWGNLLAVAVAVGLAFRDSMDLVVVIRMISLAVTYAWIDLRSCRFGIL